VKLETVVLFDPLRDGAWRKAQAARECADWSASLTVNGKAPRYVEQSAYTVWDLIEASPEKAVGEFTIGDVERLLARYPQRSIAYRIAHLNSFFRYLKRRRLITENPMEFLEPRRKVRSRVPDVFTDAEVSLLYGLPTPDGQMLRIMGECGLRRLECIQLQARNANLDLEELAVLHSKFGKSRVVPMPAKALHAFAELVTLEGLRPSDYIWYSRPGGRSVVDRSKPANYMTFARWFRRCVEQAGVRYRSPHTMRHTRATAMRRLGYQLDEIQDFLGHDSIETTRDLYVHTNVNDLKLRVRELERAIA
jgi:integrase